MEQPILNPPNPYVGTLRIFPGTLVKVAGRARPNATRFAINLQTGPSLNPRDDLALHLSPCFTPPRIVRNSLRHGAWGLEEAYGNGTVLNPHQPFEIMILAEPEQFKIAINGAHYCEFRHRISTAEISHLTVDGDVDIDRISISSIQQPSYQPSAPQPAASSYAPYPPGPNAPPMAMPMPMPMPMPGMGPGSTPAATAYQNPSIYPSLHEPYAQPPSYPGPTPMASSYSVPGGYPAHGPQGYQPQMPGGPMPTGAQYHAGGSYPQPGPHHQAQPGHSSSTSTPFGNLPIGGKALGTIAGLGLGAAAAGAVMSAMNPLKPLKKIMKPKKLVTGWGGRSSSSSNSSISSRSSFSSNSS